LIARTRKNGKGKFPVPSNKYQEEVRGVRQEVMSLPQKAGETQSDVTAGAFLLSLSSFLFLSRQERAGSSERSGKPDKIKRKEERRKRKEKDSGGDITSCCTQMRVCVGVLLLPVL
jgi:hypothetical protein